MSLLLLFAPSGGAPSPAVCLVAGVLTYKAAPAPGDLKLVLLASGELQAKAVPGGGDKLVSLAAGQWVAT